MSSKKIRWIHGELDLKTHLFPHSFGMSNEQLMYSMPILETVHWLHSIIIANEANSFCIKVAVFNFLGYIVNSFDRSINESVLL